MADIINPVIVENNGDLIHITSDGERKGIPDPSQLLPENSTVGDIPIRKGGGTGIDANTKVLFHFEETSGAFVESITNDSASVTSDASYNAGGKFSGCAEFNGSQRIKYTDTSRVYWGTGNGTVDGWMYAYDSPNSSNALVATPGGWSSGGISIGFDRSNSRQKFTIWMKEAPGDCAFTSEETYERNTWHHWALVRSEPSKLLFFVDGALIGTVDIDASRVIDWANGGSYTVIGYNEADSQGFKGRIDELRFSNVARWTEDFEPPSSPYAKEDEYWGATTADAITADAISAHNQNSSAHPDKLSLSGGTLTGELKSTAYNAFRMIQGEYGTFFRNDGNNLYLMITNAGDQNGSYNDFRPLTINLSTGQCDINGKAVYDGTGKNIAGTYAVKNRPTFTSGIEISGDLPYIDFHFNNDSGDFTSRIYETASGTLTVTGLLSVKGGIAPRYNAQTDLTSAYTSNGNSHTFTAGGWLYAVTGAGGSYAVNGGTVVSAASGATASCCVPVNKGDTVTGSAAGTLIFYPY